MKEIEKIWVSKRAPGTPATLEALFTTIENGGDTNSGSFRYGLQYCGLSEAELMDRYEEWCRGEVPKGFNKPPASPTFIVRRPR